jgi:hypothetical protein
MYVVWLINRGEITLLNLPQTLAPFNSNHLGPPHREFSHEWKSKGAELLSIKVD